MSIPRVVEELQKKACEKRLHIAQTIISSLNVENSSFVFGSTSRGTAKNDSDLDLLIVLRNFDDLTSFTSPYFPQFNAQQLLHINPKITNISTKIIVGDIEVNLEIYQLGWFIRLLSPTSVGRHKSAIFDQQKSLEKKSFGQLPAIDGTIYQFPRNVECVGDFIVFEDFEPPNLQMGKVLRIEQRKLAVFDIISDDLCLKTILEKNRDFIASATYKILGHNPMLAELPQVFGRIENKDLHMMNFSPIKASETMEIFQLDNTKEDEKLKHQLPLSLRISITHRCNLKCIYCIGEGSTPYMAEDDMTEDVFLNLIYIWKDLGGKRVKFTGGEPFLHPIFFTFIQHVNELGLEASITTNGYFLTPKNIKMLKKYNVPLVISLDTLASGQLSKLSPIGKTAAVIANQIVTAKKYGLHVSVNSVLTTHNYESILCDMIPWALANKILLRVLEESPISDISNKYLDLNDFSAKMALQHNLDIVKRDEESGDLVAIGNGLEVVHLLSSFCKRKNAYACMQHAIRIDSLGCAVVCMKRDDRIMIHTKKDLIRAINGQGVCN